MVRIILVWMTSPMIHIRRISHISSIIIHCPAGVRIGIGVSLMCPTQVSSGIMVATTLLPAMITVPPKRRTSPLPPFPIIPNPSSLQPPHLSSMQPVLGHFVVNILIDPSEVVHGALCA